MRKLTQKEASQRDLDVGFNSLDLGWNLLRVNSNVMLPDKKDLEQTVYHLVTNPHLELVQNLLMAG